MDLYIVVLEYRDERSKFAVHTHHADDAARMALARRMGWRIVDLTLDNTPKAVHIATEELEPRPEEETQDAVPFAELQAEIEHIEQNGINLANYGGEDLDEGRCRQLCAMYLREFITSEKMRRKLVTMRVAMNKERP